MSVRTALAHTVHPRSAGRATTTEGPTRRQWIRKLELVGGIVAMAGLRIAILLIHALDRRAGRSSGDAFDDGVAWSPRHC